MLQGGVNLAPAVSHVSRPPALAGALPRGSCPAGASAATRAPLARGIAACPRPPWVQPPHLGGTNGRRGRSGPLGHGGACPSLLLCSRRAPRGRPSCRAVPATSSSCRPAPDTRAAPSPPAAARGRRAAQLLRHGGCFEIPGLPSVLCKSPNLTAACGPASGLGGRSCYYLAPPPFQHPAADSEQRGHRQFSCKEAKNPLQKKLFALPQLGRGVESTMGGTWGHRSPRVASGSVGRTGLVAPRGCPCPTGRELGARLGLAAAGSSITSPARQGVAVGLCPCSTHASTPHPREPGSPQPGGSVTHSTNRVQTAEPRLHPAFPYGVGVQAPLSSSCLSSPPVQHRGAALEGMGMAALCPHRSPCPWPAVGRSGRSGACSLNANLVEKQQFPTLR